MSIVAEVNKFEDGEILLARHCGNNMEDDSEMSGIISS
jgi:hypothetical protein